MKKAILFYSNFHGYDHSLILSGYQYTSKAYIFPLLIQTIPNLPATHLPILSKCEEKKGEITNLRLII